MKCCNVCDIEKDESDFPKKKGCKDGIRKSCKVCMGKYRHDMYMKNHDRERKLRNEHCKDMYNKRLIWVRSIKYHYQCRLCRESDIEVLEFHHYNPREKTFNVQDRLHNPLSPLIKEINKCVILCSNCHLRVHKGTKQLSEELLCNLERDFDSEFIESVRYKRSS